MSKTLCQVTDQYLNDPTPAIIRALRPALARFLAVYVYPLNRTMPHLKWALDQVRLCSCAANQASVDAWLAIAPEQRQIMFEQTLFAQAGIRCAASALLIQRTAAQNPARSVTVCLAVNGGWSSFEFEFPGDFCLFENK